MGSLGELARSSWRALPLGLRASVPVVRARRAAHAVRAALTEDLEPGPPPEPEADGAEEGLAPEAAEDAPSPYPPGHRFVQSPEELDVIFTELETAWAVSEEEVRRVFSTFHIEPDLDVPEDPFSDEYRSDVLARYERISGRRYEVHHEVVDVDVERYSKDPFPFYTRSAALVGDHLTAVGQVVKALDLPPGSRVLELGAGWGNTTMAMAQTGYHVTAVDVAPDFVQLIKARASMLGLTVEALVDDFSIVHRLDETFDAVLFFESFHHCLDHLDLLAALHRVVAPGGRVLFAGEPIKDAWPVPWGLRYDGESLWAIRRNGWCELGFATSYFEEALARNGWVAERLPGVEGNPATEVFVAHRLGEAW